jgi:hypothetical protein
MGAFKAIFFVGAYVVLKIKKYARMILEMLTRFMVRHTVVYSYCGCHSLNSSCAGSDSF